VGCSGNDREKLVKEGEKEWVTYTSLMNAVHGHLWVQDVQLAIGLGM
jgi:hypothetical protein